MSLKKRNKFSRKIYVSPSFEEIITFISQQKEVNGKYEMHDTNLYKKMITSTNS
jgi:hypothetical protein